MKPLKSKDFAAVLGELDSFQKFASELEHLNPQENNRYWFSLRHHVASYFGAKDVEYEAKCNTAKKISKDHGIDLDPTPATDLRDAETAWMNIQRPEMVIWVYEALGLDKSMIERTVQDVKRELQKMQQAGKVVPSTLTSIARGAFDWSEIEKKSVSITSVFAWNCKSEIPTVSITIRSKSQQG